MGAVAIIHTDTGYVCECVEVDCTGLTILDKKLREKLLIRFHDIDILVLDLAVTLSHDDQVMFGGITV